VELLRLKQLPASAIRPIDSGEAFSAKQLVPQLVEVLESCAR
jgi:hypothetical protein